MPIRPNLLERLLFYRLDRAPAPLLDMLSAAGFEALALAVDLGVFEAIESGHDRPAAIADAVDADPDGIRTLLAFLDPLGYVESRDGGYRNAPMTRRWLLGDGENLAPWLAYWHDLQFAYWGEHLETAVREGRPERTMYEWLDERGGWETAQRGFRAVATLLAGPVLDAVDLPQGRATLLDVGGGHGYYAIEACRRRPALRATILDVPAALDVARAEVERAGLADRVTCRGADALVDDLGDGFDLAFCFNVVHGYDPTTNRALVERVREALAPGGRLAVLDQFAGEAPMNVAPVGLAATRFVYETALDATVYEAAAIERWLADAGFVEVETTRFRTLPGNGLVVGRRD